MAASYKFIVSQKFSLTNLVFELIIKKKLNWQPFMEWVCKVVLILK